jgi:hypothetical protein
MRIYTGDLYHCIYSTSKIWLEIFNLVTWPWNARNTDLSNPLTHLEDPRLRAMLRHPPDFQAPV